MTDNNVFVRCIVCGVYIRPDEKHTIDNCVSELQEQVAVYEQLLNGRARLMSVIPECAVHGHQCVPHAMEWVEEAKGLERKLAEHQANTRLIAGSPDLLESLNEIIAYLGDYTNSLSTKELEKWLKIQWLLSKAANAIEKATAV